MTLAMDVRMASTAARIGLVFERKAKYVPVAGKVLFSVTVVPDAFWLNVSSLPAGE